MQLTINKQPGNIERLTCFNNTVDRSTSKVLRITLIRKSIALISLSCGSYTWSLLFSSKRFMLYALHCMVISRRGALQFMSHYVPALKRPKSYYILCQKRDVSLKGCMNMIRNSEYATTILNW